MRKFFVCILLLGVLSLSSQLALAELDSWVTTNYPTGDYLSQQVGGDLNKTIDSGKKELIRNIFQNANALFNPDEEKPINKWVPEGEQRLLEQQYATALINLRDMRTEQSHLVQHFQTAAIQSPASNSSSYRLVNVKRRELMMQYVARERQLREAINEHLAKAAQAESTNQQQAAAEYLHTYPLFEQMKEAVLIQQAVAPPQSQDRAAVYRKLMEPITGTNDGSLQMTLPEVYQRVNQLQYQGMTTNTIADVASSVAQQLAIQTENLGGVKGDIVLKGFTYRNSLQPIAQSTAFRQELKQLLEQMGWQVIIPAPNTRGLVEKVSLTIEGTAWKNADASSNGTFQTTVHNRDTGDMVGSSIVSISAELTTNLQPNNFEEITKVEEAVATYNMKTAPKEVLTGDELKVDVWTNKGLEQSILQEGDEFIIYCEVNKPSYIRLLYVLADDSAGGRYTLLHDSTYIDETKVGKPVSLGEFVVLPPFGSEKLIVLAQSTPHEKVDFIRKGPYKFLDTKEAGEAVNLAFAPPKRGLAELERDTMGISVSTEPKLQ